MKGQPFEHTYLSVRVVNPADPNLCWEGAFRVDYGAVDSMAPGKHLEAIGLLPLGNRRYKTADRDEVYLDITSARLEFLDEVVGASIVVVDDDTPPTLGRTALLSAGIEEDPIARKLIRRPAARLQGGFKPINSSEPV